MEDLLQVVCWKWSDPRWPTAYRAEHVNTMGAMLRKHLTIPHKLCCVTNDPSGIDRDIRVIPMWGDLAEMGKCYRRLKIFAKDMEQLVGKRILSIDLDSVITGNIDKLVNVPDEFKIVKDTQVPTPYNGSMFLLTAGSRSRVWEEFDPIKSPQRGRDLGYCACDQAWIGACLGKNEPTWSGGDGVKSFRNEVILKQAGVPLPDDKIIFFHGSRKPWESEVQGRFPWVKDHYTDPRKRLVILGGARCVYDDLAKYLPPPGTKVMAINDMVAAYQGKLDYSISLHPDKLADWQRQRRDKGLNQDHFSIAHTKHSRAKIDKVTNDWGGSSGLFAVKAALELGFDHIVLCGVPMDSQPNMFRPNEQKWNDFQRYKDAWPVYIPQFLGKVFSMSGWTKEQLNP